MHPIQKQNHLFWRAGFGPTPDMLIQSTAFDPQKYFTALWLASEKKPVPFRVVENTIDGLANGIGAMARMQQRQNMEDEAAKAEARKKQQQQNREAVRSLNLTWMDEMVNSPAQLREKVALFWHGHFSCRIINSYFQQQLINTIREHALGDFGTLLTEVSKSPAMLQFLNNQQNRKNSPNENFAREVMELFTLGRGNYTEQDVKEAARAFTGWGFNLQGEFQFRPFVHDNGQKTVLGKTGTFSGEDVLKILLEQPATAKFICTKFYRFFVNDTVQEAKVELVAKRFFESGYQMKTLLQDMFTAEWFYASEQVGTRIKGPIELMVGLQRQLPMQLKNKNALLLLQRALGQILFYPPNVAGWPGGKTWIDSSSLLLRMRIPQLLASNEGVDVALKNDDDNDMGRGNKGMNRFVVQANIDWKKALEPIGKLPRDKQYDMLSAVMLQTGRRPEIDFMKQFIQGDQEGPKMTIALMSLPEYQLC